MRRILILLAALPATFAPASGRGETPPGFAWKDGDRVVLIGDALIERDQKFGYLEAIITARNPDKTITFRNLGWSGDTPYGIARARFGTQADGFQHLKDHVLALKPTVILIGYGMTDSFDGEAGLSRFREGMNALLDAIAPTRARVVLLSPIAHEDLGRPLPDPARHNEALRLYRDATRDVAKSRGVSFIDLFERFDRIMSSGQAAEALQPPLTDDGIHVIEEGALAFGLSVASELGEAPSAKPAISDRTVTARGVRCEMTSRVLAPPRSTVARASTDVFPLDGLADFEEGAPGSYILKIDGRAVAKGTAAEWRGKSPVKIGAGPDREQFERLRQAIIAKNRLYFYRWRPQNETYLFGFRKHEQGNNAREIPLFDPLVEEKEAEIARLRVPVSHVYELTREGEEPK